MAHFSWELSVVVFIHTYIDSRLIIKLNVITTAHNQVSIMLRYLIKLFMLSMCHQMRAEVDENNTFVDYRFQNLTSFAITDLSNPVSYIMYLSLRGNNLDRIPNDITKLSSLERLILSENPQITFPPDGSPFLISRSLIDLDCESCDVKVIYNRSLRRLPLLETLRLPNNTIQMIEKRAFQHNTNIRMLDFRHNKLTSLPSTILVGLSKIKHLDLSGNRELAPQDGQPFLESSSLKILKCNNCGFSTTQVVTFSKLPNLQELHLAENRLLVAPCLLPALKALGVYSMKIITDYQRCLRKKFPFVKVLK
ncbi:protein flightless-1-like [Aedes albopictus]|uniref:Leucine-rich repeat protein n=1 Tax=Aedes albopictus TaxID=7160 RepID=A0ABM1ZSV9_AEDAL|nr:protein flightless-1-like [Aedes albopictus]